MLTHLAQIIENRNTEQSVVNISLFLSSTMLMFWSIFSVSSAFNYD